MKPSLYKNQKKQSIMKKTILLLVAICLSAALQAAVTKTVSVATAGTLHTYFTTGEQITVTDLTVTGILDARDFKFMRDTLYLLAKLDLSGVSISAYSGMAGTVDNTAYNTAYAANVVPQFAFEYCSSLTSITIPNTATSIGDQAFINCYGLTSVTIPTSVTSIGGYAFDGCSGLTSITIPTSVTSIGVDAFGSCTGLTSITIPFSVNSIGEGAFEYCTGLTSIIIPTSVTHIGVYAFYHCSGLTSFTIPISIACIGDNTFEGCTGLTSVTIPTSVTSIGEYAFSECSGLTSVTIPTSVTSIGSYTFSRCRGLTSVTIPTSVTSIGEGAFFDCIVLTSVTIPTSVTSIGDEAFESSGLTSITIPTSVTSIGEGVFAYCYDLTSIYAYNTVPVDLSNSPIVFFDVNKTTCTLHVPVGSKDAYQAAVQWRDFNIVEDLPTAVNNATASKVKVSIQNGQAVISGLALGETIAIYNLQGTLIYNQAANADIVAVSLPAHGVYLVKVGAESVKVEN